MKFVAWDDYEEYADHDAYVERMQGGRAKNISLPKKYFEAEFHPRPQGWQQLDKDLRVLDAGTETTKEFAARFDALGFGYSAAGDLRTAALKKDYKYTSFLLINGSAAVNYKNVNWSSKITDFFDGWDSSYHDANWNGMGLLVGYGPTPEVAEERRDSMIAHVIKGEDAVKRRFQLRQLVRSGD